MSRNVSSDMYNRQDEAKGNQVEIRIVHANMFQDIRSIQKEQVDLRLCSLDMSSIP